MTMTAKKTTKKKTKKKAPSKVRERAPRLEIETVEPEVRTQLPREDPRHFWPEGQEFPVYVARRSILPCEACRRIQLPTGGQAVVVTSSRSSFVYLQCKSCRHRWKKPAKTVN